MVSGIAEQIQGLFLLLFAPTDSHFLADLVADDLHCQSGEALLAKCAEYVAIQFDLEPEPQRLEVSQIILDGRC